MYVFNVVKVKWVLMVIISDLCSHTQKSLENCVYALAATRKRQVAPEHLLQTRSTFSKSVMVLFHSLQGSAATHLRCGGQCGMGFVEISWRIKP